MANSTLRAAVVGVGHLGRFHAQKYAALPNATLVAVADVDGGRAAAVATECATRAVTDYRTLLDQVDVVSIAVPAHHHYRIAREFLTHGVHVLLEKPITVAVDDAQALVKLADQRKRILQVGHLERFNPAVLALEGRLLNPMFIESNRIAPFKPRGTDVSVILDLMIHDIDLILALVGAPIARIDASGLAVLTDAIDIANARLQFSNGCTANVTASRVSAKNESKLRLFQQDAYFSLDLREKQLTIQRKGATESYPGIPRIETERQDFSSGSNDALLAEITAFLASVSNGTPPAVSGVVGLRALQTANEIMRLLQALKAN